MASTISIFLGNGLLDHIFGAVDMTAPASIYVSAHTADPTRTGANEVSGNAYARQKVGAGGGDSTFSAASSRTTDNDTAITWLAASGGDWGEITYFGIWNALTNGDFFLQAPLTVPRPINDGDVLQINAGFFDWTAD